MQIFICWSLHLCIAICLYVSRYLYPIYIHIYIHTCIYMYVYLSTYSYLFLFIQLYIWISVHNIYIYTYISIYGRHALDMMYWPMNISTQCPLRMQEEIKQKRDVYNLYYKDLVKLQEKALLNQVPEVPNPQLLLTANPKPSPKLLIYCGFGLVRSLKTDLVTCYVQCTRADMNLNNVLGRARWDIAITSKFTSNKCESITT